MHATRWLTAAALVAVTMITTPVRDASACQPVHLELAPLASQTAIAVDGGLLLAQVRDVDGDVAVAGVTVDGAPATVETDYLAAGLERWRLKLSAGAQVTVAGHGPAATGTTPAPATLAVVAAGRRLAAPAVRASRSTLRKSRTPRPPMPGSPYTTLTIELARALPAGAVALVVYGKRPADGGLAWAPVTAGQTSFQIVGGGKGCGGGFGSIYAGDRLSFAWVDAAGRLSARSPARPVALAR